jgi:hypothetical protein
MDPTTVNTVFLRITEGTGYKILPKIDSGLNVQDDKSKNDLGPVAIDQNISTLGYYSLDEAAKYDQVLQNIGECAELKPEKSYLDDASEYMVSDEAANYDQVLQNFGSSQTITTDLLNYPYSQSYPHFNNTCYITSLLESLFSLFVRGNCARSTLVIEGSILSKLLETFDQRKNFQGDINAGLQFS